MADPNVEYATYGQFAWMYNSDPQVKALIDQASAEDWPAEKLAASIKGTAWWQGRVAAEREWERQIADDPREALNMRNQKAEEIAKQAQILGVTLRPGVADSFADSFFRYGWTPIQLENSILSQFTYERGKTTGAAATIETELRNAARDYTVPITDKTVQDWIISINQGRTTVEQFRAHLAQIAAADNPWMAEALNAGFSVRNIMDPYVSRAAQELGISEAEVDLSDPKWRQLLEVTNEKGERVRPDTRTILRMIRTDERFGWDQTETALQSATALNEGLLKMFGAVG